jgi:putative MFS transporter
MIDFEELPLRRFHLRVALATSAGAFEDGFGLGIIGIALNGATPALHLDAIWAGLLGGASLAGLFAGSFFCGPVVDRIGRRPMYGWNMPLVALFSALQMAIGSGTQLLLLRLVIGFLLGTDYVVGKTLLSEFAPRLYRGRLVGALSMAWAGGFACAYATGYGLMILGPGAWRWMLLVSAVPALVIAPLRWSIPESPLWLLRRGDFEKAAHIAHRTLGPDVALPITGPPAVFEHGRWRQLFSRQWRTRTAVGCIFFACQVIPFFAIGTFISQVMRALGIRSAYFGGLVYNLAILGGAIIGFLIIDRISRRSFLIGTFAITAATLAALSTRLASSSHLMVLLFGVFAAVLSAASNLSFAYVPELFPTDLRASGIGVAVAASRIGSAASTFLLPIVMEQFGPQTALGVCVAVLLVGAIVCYLWAPETRHVGFAALDRGIAD